jgi:hypothetical protein
MDNQRQSLMMRPVPARRQTLAKQAEEIKAHYNATREERIHSQGGRIYEYDVGEAPLEDNPSEDNPSSENSEEPEAL